MAINYTKIGWDTSKYVNPTNMNQMDDGIKAACDGVDAHDTAIAGKVNKSGDTMTGSLKISSDGYSQPALRVNNTNANVANTWIQFENNGSAIGYLGVDTNKKPIFFDTAQHEIALADNVVSKKGMTVPATVTTENDLISIIATQALSDGFGAHVYTGIWTANNYFEAVVYAIESNHVTGEVIFGGYTYAPYIITFSYYNGTAYTRSIQ